MQFCQQKWYHPTAQFSLRYVTENQLEFSVSVRGDVQNSNSLSRTLTWRCSFIVNGHSGKLKWQDFDWSLVQSVMQPRSSGSGGADFDGVLVPEASFCCTLVRRGLGHPRVGIIFSLRNGRV